MSIKYIEEICLRTASEDDAKILRDIYAPYVEHTAVSFEYTVPSVEEFRGRIRRTKEKYPYLLAESGGEILGYAYASPFHERRAYDWVAETSIYLREDKRRLGLGRKLYEALEKILRMQGITDLYACVACPDGEDAYLNRDSVLFHQRMGFQTVGQFPNCGYKFHRWYHMIWMRKNIGEHKGEQPEVKSFSSIQQSVEERLEMESKRGGPQGE